MPCTNISLTQRTIIKHLILRWPSQSSLLNLSKNNSMTIMHFADIVLTQIYVLLLQMSHSTALPKTSLNLTQNGRNDYRIRYSTVIMHCIYLSLTKNYCCCLLKRYSTVNMHVINTALLKKVFK